MGTKYYDDNFHEDRTTIDIVSLSSENFESNDREDKEYICPHCRVNLICIDAKTGEYYCNRDGISFFPEDEVLRTADKVSVPLSDNERQALVAYTLEPKGAAATKYNKPIDMPGSGVDTLRDKGIRITSDEYRSGDGRVLKRNKRD